MVLFTNKNKTASTPRQDLWLYAIKKNTGGFLVNNLDLKAIFWTYLQHSWYNLEHFDANCWYRKVSKKATKIFSQITTHTQISCGVKRIVPKRHIALVNVVRWVQPKAYQTSSDQVARQPTKR